MTPLEIHNICKKYNIKNYTINDDMSISVEGDDILSHESLKSLPIKFKEVTGYFYGILPWNSGCWFLLW